MDEYNNKEKIIYGGSKNDLYGSKKIIDEKELYVGLDVLEIEPMKAHHPLLHVKHQERLIITPHIAWASMEARKKLMDLVVQNIQTFLNR